MGLKSIVGDGDGCSEVGGTDLLSVMGVFVAIPVGDNVILGFETSGCFVVGIDVGSTLASLIVAGVVVAALVGDTVRRGFESGSCTFVGMAVGSTVGGIIGETTTVTSNVGDGDFTIGTVEVGEDEVGAKVTNPSLFVLGPFDALVLFDVLVLLDFCFLP